MYDVPNPHSGTCNYVLSNGQATCNCVFKSRYQQIASIESHPIGRKDDSGKCQFGLIPVDALWELGKVYTVGASKYDPWNWANGIKYSRVYDALLRHLFKWWWHKEQNDPETNCHHLASVAWAAFTLMHYELNKEKYNGWDNRPNFGDGEYPSV